MRFRRKCGFFSKICNCRHKSMQLCSSRVSCPSLSPSLRVLILPALRATVNRTAISVVRKERVKHKDNTIQTPQIHCSLKIFSNCTKGYEENDRLSKNKINSFQKISSSNLGDTLILKWSQRRKQYENHTSLFSSLATRNTGWSHLSMWQRSNKHWFG